VSNRTEIVNVTAIPTSPARAGLLGLVLGVLLASLAVVAADRWRRPVYGAENDLALPIIALVDPARPGADPERPWYSDAVGRRRSDVQTLRAVLDGVTAGGTVTIGLSGLSVGHAAVQELAADLSTSIAASGCEVLLMDTIFDEPSVLFEYGSTGTDLADIVTGRTSSGDAQEDVKLALGDRERVVPELLSLRAGRLSADPVDAVAGRRFRELLDVAADFVEIVIVAVPDWGHPETDVLAQRLDHLVLVGRSGITTALDLKDPAAELGTRHAQAVGLVLLRKRRLFGTRTGSRRSGGSRSTRQTGIAIARPEPPGSVSEVHEPNNFEAEDLPDSAAVDIEASEIHGSHRKRRLLGTETANRRSGSEPVVLDSAANSATDGNVVEDLPGPEASDIDVPEVVVPPAVTPDGEHARGGSAGA
jgi:hypothetical protein